MRNLKRALSLALASVMLLGMMVVGSSAAFADADKIVNTEAVEITAGLGLFAGSDGKFNPTGTVTRAQMAAVIAKMLYGSEINADQFKGSGKFTDTVAFEGGWAEGYINLCSNLGIVGGYGDGTFKPGQAVTTAEAATMIINALGVDAGEGTWPLTVMAKAEEMKLFEELAVKPGTNVALTRDQLASIVLEGIKFSPSGVKGYSITVDEKVYKFDTLSDALAAAETAKKGLADIDEIVGEDALWATVFGVKEATGFVTANQATGAECTIVAGIGVDLETGLDMIGHYVTVYYSEEYDSEAKPGTAYCIVDEAEYIVVSDTIEKDRKDFNAAFGAKELDIAKAGLRVDGAYEYTAFDGKDKVLAIAEYQYSGENAKSAAAGTYVVYDGDLIGFIAFPEKYVVEVEKVTTTANKETIKVTGFTAFANGEADDEVVEYDGIAKEDIAVLVRAQDMYVLTKANKMEGTITKTATNADGDDVLTINGTNYVVAGYAVKRNTTDLEVAKAEVSFTSTYAIYTDANGKVIGFTEVEGSADLGDIVYDLGAYTVDTKDAYGNEVTFVYAQVVDMEGKESSLLIGITYAKPTSSLKNVGVQKDAIAKYETGFKAFELAEDPDAKKAGIMESVDTIAKKPETGKATIFVDTFTGEFDGKATKFDITNGLAFMNDTTKFVLVDGAAGKALKTTVLTENVKLEGSKTYNVIASADKNGNITLEVVFYAEDGLKLPSTELFYVSNTNADKQAEAKDGVELEVYFITTGKFETITVDKNFAPDAAGFYSYVYDATDKVYTDLDRETTEGQIFYGETMTNLYGGTKLVTAKIKGIDATGAAVIDTRSETELDKSEYAKVETLADLADLVSDEIKVTLDVMLDADDQETVVAIFVTEVK